LASGGLGIRRGQRQKWGVSQRYHICERRAICRVFGEANRLDANRGRLLETLTQLFGARRMDQAYNRRGTPEHRSEFVGARIRPTARAHIDREAARLGITPSKALELIVLAHAAQPRQQQPEAAA
jgi:hypothetical protein